MSELYGRYPVFNVANALFIVGIAVAGLSQTSGTFIFARFLTGCAVASNVLNPAIIGDMFPTEQRGSAMSLIMLAPLLGGAVGPGIAGAIVQTATWRHIMWMAIGLASAAELAFLLLFRETYKVAILQRRAAKLRNETGIQSLKTEFDGDEEGGSALWENMKRPAIVLSGSSVLQLFSLYGAVMFSFFYIMSTTLPDILLNLYGFDPALTGTSFMSFSESFGSSLSRLLTCEQASAQRSASSFATSSWTASTWRYRIAANPGNSSQRTDCLWSSSVPSSCQSS